MQVRLPPTNREISKLRSVGGHLPKRGWKRPSRNWQKWVLSIRRRWELLGSATAAKWWNMQLVTPICFGLPSKVALVEGIHTSFTWEANSGTSGSQTRVWVDGPKVNPRRIGESCHPP